MKTQLKKFQTILKYSFNDESRLLAALTHKSFSVDENKRQENNERLEFLGDAILNFVIAEELLQIFPNEQEGVLSKKRAALVNLNKLADVAKKFELDKFINFGPGEVKQGNHLNGRIQGSCVEALIGAIYQDSSFETVKKWVLSQFSKDDFYNEINVSFQMDYKSRLQELTQKYKLGTPIYEVVLTTGPSHRPQFLVALKLNSLEMSRSEGSTKKIAEQKAAELYLNELIKTLKE